jgi:hypothetical protein
MLVVCTPQLLCRFPFQQLLHDQLCSQLYQCANRVLLTGKPTVQQVVQLLANLFAWWYPLHDVWSFLPFGMVGWLLTIVYHTSFDFAGLYCHRQRQCSWRVKKPLYTILSAKLVFWTISGGFRPSDPLHLGFAGSEDQPVVSRSLVV